MEEEWFGLIPRCGICSLELVKGDEVVAVHPDGQSSRKYRFDPEHLFYDVLTGLTYNPVFWETWDILDDAVGCHFECIRLEPGRRIPRRERFLATAYDWYPLPFEIARRERWLRSAWAATLHGILRPFSAPMEICEIIAGYCSLQPAAAAAARTFWEEAPKVPAHRFHLSGRVWARHVEFEGLRYIACLTNDPGDGLGTLVYDPEPGKNEAAQTLYLAEDHLGLREVLISGSSPAAPEVDYCPGLWWKTVEIGGLSEFQVLTDGTKIRSVYPVALESPPDSEMFELPLPSGKQLRWHRIHRELISLRMTSFVCNDPATIGYSAFCDENPYYIRSHTAGERDLSFYDSWSPKTPEMRKAGWLYIPVGVDERITEVWVRSYVCGLVTETFAVIFRTNKGRCLVLGSHPASGGGNYQYALVCRPAEHGPSRIYFDLSLYGIHSLAVDTPLPSGAVVLPSPAPPVSPCPELGPYEIFTYTSAALDGVVEVTPCRSDVAEFGPAITGLLLRYADGRQASLGQVRLDRLEQPVKVAGARCLCLHFRITELGCPNVYRMTFGGRRGSGRFRVPWRGTLEWWFSRLQCRVWHEGRSSPPTVQGHTRLMRAIMLSASNR